MNSREKILKALYAIEYEGAYSGEALNRVLRGAIAPVDRGFITEVTLGVLRNKSALDIIIRSFSKLRLKKLSPYVLLILRMGVYQIYYMDKVPFSAACNEAVKLAKKYANRGAVGFVNGVLRSVAREADNITLYDGDNEAERLSAVYSYPMWITGKLISRFGAEETEAFYKNSHMPHDMWLRANRLKTTPSELADKLCERGIIASVYTEVPDCVSVRGAINVSALSEYKDGLFTVQNISSMRAVLELNPKPGEFVMDLCAAPGGKTTYIAEIMDGCGDVRAFDVHEHKIKLIESAAQRLGIGCITAVQHDARVLIPEYEGRADKVLVDAPCSGLGVIRSKPEIKWTRREEDVSELCGIQREILDNAARYVKPGGTLVYSTCTILREENEEQAERFLKENADFKMKHNELILPHKSGGSGFYIARFERELKI